MNKIQSAATRLATISATAKLPSWLLGMSPAHQKAYLKEHPDSPYAGALSTKQATTKSPAKTVAPAAKDNIPANYRIPKPLDKDGVMATPVVVRMNNSAGKLLVDKIEAIGYTAASKPLTKATLDRILRNAANIVDLKAPQNGKIQTRAYITSYNGKWYWLDLHTEEYYGIKQPTKVAALIEAAT